MKSKFLLSALCISFSTSFLVGQNKDYIKLMNDKTAKFEQVQSAFENYWKGKTPKKGEGYKVFKRYEAFMKDRVNPQTGRFENATASYLAYQTYFANNAQSKSSSVPNVWTAIKPVGAVPLNGGAGRINCVVFDPTNSSNVFAGAAGGGLWRSTDGGQSWSTNTDQLASLGISDVAVNPKNPSILYAATGDRDGGDTYAIGVLKSTDGGLTWNPTGLSATTSQNKTFARILIHPNNPDTVLAAGTDGIYKTYNGGLTWTLKYSGSIKDMEFKPNDPNTVYASNTSVIKSTNNGETFTTVSGISSPTRIALAVTAANSAYVYAIAVNGSFGLQGIYRSINSGTSFALRSSAPNILSSDGTGAGGQGWYDLAIAVSPTNADEIYTGGINIYKSLNGGQNMFKMTDWTGTSLITPYVHADIHDLVYNPDGDLFVGCDGGVFNTYDFGTSWSDFSSGLAIGQIYHLSTAQTDTSLTVSGWQDNGTNLYSNGAASQILGGDGMDCQINPLNAAIIYGTIQEGIVLKSTNGGNSFNLVAGGNSTGVNGPGPFVTNCVLDPQNPSNVYVGKTQLYVSNNAGNTFSQVGTLPGSGFIDQISVSSNPINQHIYVSKGSTIFVKKGTSAFVLINSNLPAANITDIQVSPNDQNKVWVTLSGYNANRVFYSSNAGTSWTNISAGLPAIPANCIIHEKNTANLYVGTDVGVFYKDTNSAIWIPYGTGLPNVEVFDLDIQYNLGKLRIATYGRGLWETSVFQSPTVAPVPSFSVAQQTICRLESVQFTDNSSNSPLVRSWTFTGGTPSTSNAFNPTITYNSAGVYPVKLKVSNAIGADSLTIAGYITVNAGPAVLLDSSSILKCRFEDTVAFNATGASYYTLNTSTSIVTPANGVFNTYSQNAITYIVKGFDAAGCFDLDTVVVSIKPSPSPINIASITGGFKATSSNPTATSTFQWYVNGMPIIGAINDTLLTTNAGAYVCKVTIFNGCLRASNSILFSALDAVSKNQLSFNVIPNPSNGKFVLQIESKENIKKIEMTDVLGRKIMDIKVDALQFNKQLIIENGGIYFISIINNNGKTIGTKKVIVE
jgi:PKD repeat protein